MMTAMFDIVEKHDIDPARVKKLRIALSQPVFDLHGIFAKYKAKFEALLSAHYVAAAILHDREMTLAQFEPARYDDPKLRRFAEQVEVRADRALSGVQSLVDIETADGKTFSARCDHPRGLAREPPLACADREQVPHLCEGTAFGRAGRGRDRRGGPAGATGLGAHADGRAARNPATGACPDRGRGARIGSHGPRSA